MESSTRILCRIFLTVVVILGTHRQTEARERLNIELKKPAAAIDQEQLGKSIGNDLKKANPQLSADEADAYAEAILEASKRFSLDPHLIKGVIITESHARPEVKNKDGSCIGSMQVSSYWWDAALRKAGIIRNQKDYFDIKCGVLAGAYVLDHYIGREGTLARALAKYSGGAKNYHAKVVRNAGRSSFKI